MQVDDRTTAQAREEWTPELDMPIRCIEDGHVCIVLAQHEWDTDAYKVWNPSARLVGTYARLDLNKYFVPIDATCKLVLEPKSGEGESHASD